MRLSALRLIAIALCCCALGALPAHAAANRASAVNLKLSDLPAGFARTSHTTSASSTGASDEEEFTTKGLARLLSVASEVMWFPSSDQAKGVYKIIVSQVAEVFKAAGLTQYKRMVISPVGTKYEAFEGSGKANGVALTMFMVFFQHGDYETLVSGAGITGLIQAQQVLKLAHTIDTRIQYAG